MNSRTKSTSELDGPEVNGTADQKDKIKFAVLPLLIHSDLGDITRKNWTYLTNEVNDKDYIRLQYLVCAS